MSLRRHHLEVMGVSCSNCSKTVDDAVRSLDGVDGADVDFATDEGTVEYDPDEVSLSAVCAAIEDAGYTPAASTVERSEREGRTAMLVARAPNDADAGELLGIVADADTVTESAGTAARALRSVASR